MMRNTKEPCYGLGLSASTAQGVRGMLAGMFNFAVYEKLILDNPVKNTILPPAPLSSINPLTIEEAWAFISVKDQYWYGDTFSFALQTGMRPEEYMALMEEDIDFKAGEIRIERACKWVDGVFTGFGPVKTRRSNRVIEMAPEMAEFLKKHLEKQKQRIQDRIGAGSSYGEPEVLRWIKEYRYKQRHKYTRTNLVFPARDGSVPTPGNLRLAFKRMLRRAGFTGSRLEVRLYDLRHTHATILLTLGFPDHEVAERMGHTVNTLNNIYAHKYKSRGRKASALFISLIPLAVANSAPLSDVQALITSLVDKMRQDLEEDLGGLLSKIVSNA